MCENADCKLGEGLDFQNEQDCVDLNLRFRHFSDQHVSTDTGWAEFLTSENQAVLNKNKWKLNGFHANFVFVFSLGVEDALSCMQLCSLYISPFFPFLDNFESDGKFQPNFTEFCRILPRRLQPLLPRFAL